MYYNADRATATGNMHIKFGQTSSQLEGVYHSEARKVEGQRGQVPLQL